MTTPSPNYRRTWNWQNNNNTKNRIPCHPTVLVPQRPWCWSPILTKPWRPSHSSINCNIFSHHGQAWECYNYSFRLSETNKILFGSRANVVWDGTISYKYHTIRTELNFVAGQERKQHKHTHTHTHTHIH